LKYTEKKNSFAGNLLSRTQQSIIAVFLEVPALFNNKIAEAQSHQVIVRRVEKTKTSKFSLEFATVLKQTSHTNSFQKF
jgi:hypothetical protein